MDWKNEKVLVIGAGISGFAAAKIAKSLGAQTILSDAKQEADLKYDFKELRAAGVELVFGVQEMTLLDGVKRVIVSPAVPIRIPILTEAIKRGIPVISEVELAYQIAQSPICAITGTNGKTTTVTLLGELLRTQYTPVGVGGNIGTALSEVAREVGAGGYIAAEISSYQMEASHTFRPHVAAILNITPDHLKRHGSMEVYQAMKEKIFSQQTEEDFCVLNFDGLHRLKIVDEGKGKVVFFSGLRELDEGAFIKGDMLTIAWAGQNYPLCTVSELGIKGAHNVENAIAASLCAFLAGVPAEKMIPVLKSFCGVEHRIEYVTEIAGVPYYNDSKATNTDSAIKALETFDGHIVLLAGGDDKMTELSDFMKLVKERVEELILIGDAAARFEEAAQAVNFPKEHIHRAGYDMGKAVEFAVSLAKKPQVVLLSPACASFDMYDGFEERGRDFKRLVKKMAGDCA